LVNGVRLPADHQALDALQVVDLQGTLGTGTVRQLTHPLPSDRAVVDGPEAILQFRQAVLEALGRLRFEQARESERYVAQLLAQDAQTVKLRIRQLRPALAELHDPPVPVLQQVLGEILHRRIEDRPRERMTPRAVMQTLEQLQLHRRVARIVQRLDG